jgi:hypothetical protein
MVGSMVGSGGLVGGIVGGIWVSVGGTEVAIFSIGILQLDKIFQVLVVQNGAADGQDNFAGAGRGRVSNGAGVVARRVFFALAEKNRAEEKNGPLFIHLQALYTSRGAISMELPVPAGRGHPAPGFI